MSKIFECKHYLTTINMKLNAVMGVFTSLKSLSDVKLLFLNFYLRFKRSTHSFLVKNNYFQDEVENTLVFILSFNIINYCAKGLVDAIFDYLYHALVCWCVALILSYQGITTSIAFIITQHYFNIFIVKINLILTYIYTIIIYKPIFYILGIIYSWSWVQTVFFFWNFEHLYCLNSCEYDEYFNYFNYFKGYVLNVDSWKTNFLDQNNKLIINHDYIYNNNHTNYFYKSNTLNLNIYSKYSPNFTFLSKISLTLTILSVWQYWWWLYFIGIAILFNKIIFKLFFDTNLYVNPKIHNSLKSNGRWGDIIASTFPVFWCSNILLNSNLILRLTENHSEAGWMTLRVRGKQWYWVYKLPIHLKQDFEKLPIIIGRGNKLNLNNLEPINTTFYKKYFLKKQKPIFIKNYKNDLFFFKKNMLTSRFKKYYSFFFTKKDDFYNFVNQTNFNYYLLARKVKANKNYYKFINNNIILTKSNNFQQTTQFLQINNNNSIWYKKYYRHFFTIQQQPKTNWLLKNKVNLNSHKKTKFFEINTLKKKNFLNKTRLISSYNTLLLPTNVNITVITNSFDVVHSWFIPGLGVKFDCVPGRSTHYTLRINKPGIYLGHCAEICGRFHHHMPIKIVALPLNQFLYYYDCYYPTN